MGNHLAPFRLMRVRPGTCPQCATAHKPEQPHNQQSLTYQYWFYNEHGRWPAWADAMAHCDDHTREMWAEQLAAHGITVGATPTAQAERGTQL